MFNEVEKKPTGGQPPVIHTFRLLAELTLVLSKFATQSAEQMGPYFQRKLLEIEDNLFAETYEQSLFNPEERQRRIKIFISDHS